MKNIIISGPRCSGKTTISQSYTQLFEDSEVIQVSVDTIENEWIKEIPTKDLYKLIVVDECEYDAIPLITEIINLKFYKCNPLIIFITQDPVFADLQNEFVIYTTCK